MPSNTNDIVAIFSKGLLGAVPFVGPLAAELVNTVIPNQRIDRLESLLSILESKLEDKDKKEIKTRMESAETIDLIEDGFIQASRALTDERKDYIASLIKNSLTNEKVNHLEYKRMLKLLDELNAIEILILKSHSVQHTEEEAEFLRVHEKTVLVQQPYDGDSQEEYEKYALFQANNTHLTNLGLLYIKFQKPKPGELPDFDESTGMVKSEGYGITILGRMLLKSIDQYTER